MASRYDLSDQTALVTGGTRGIGRAIAAALARSGARVVVSSRKAAAVESTVAELREEGSNVEGIPANVGRLDEVYSLAEACLSRFARVDILVNNAAANPVFGGVEDTTPEAYAKIMDVNLRAPFELARRLMPAMKANGRGAIVNISSIGGLTPERGLGMYSVSKAALISLTQVMAREWGTHGIRANAICPGFIQTDFSQVLWSDDTVMENIIGKQPISRLGTPEDVAEMAVFLASPAASFCTGGVYLVDGGYLLRGG
ncbi:MAG: SDR family oxidoreductase [Gemmatimonadaceae bacterium]|nr:SDR family oxidoreductase [Gemmatimonadaceae bacterium]